MRAGFANDFEHPKVSSLADLRARLLEAEETLDAIRNGDVDAVVVGGAVGQQVYTLKNADRPYRVLVEQMQEGALTLSEDGIVLYCNERLANIVGIRRESLLGETISRFFRDGERDSFHRLLGRIPDRATSKEYTLLSADGAEVPVNISLVDLKVDEGMPRVICSIVTDLTHNRRRSHELAAANTRLAKEIHERRRAEDRLKLALDAAGMGNWDLDLATGEVQRSLRHDQIFGYAELLPKWGLEFALDHFVEDDRDGAGRAFLDAKICGSIEFECRIRRANDQAQRWVHLTGRTYYQAGLAVRIAGVIADVTEQRKTEDRLRHAQKMEAVGQLTGGIAHDFNNLLMIVGGSLDMLSRRLPTDERIGRLLEAARQGVGRGARLNQQLLAFARRQDLRTEAVCIDDLIPGLLHLLDRAVGETVNVRIEPTPQVWYCRTDPNQLETAILNLAINARDAMHKGGTLTLRTENRAVDPTIAASHGVSADDYAVVSVADTGIGMGPETLSRVFEPFFTTKEIGKGTGLGLSQVYGFAKQSEGFVTIESELGEGTTVSIHLPRTARPKSVTGKTNQTTANIPGRGVILVVEDDPDVRATASIMLEDLGYEVQEAATGPAALELIQRGETVDLVFTDVIMPDGMNGFELAREIRRRRPTLPVLLTSGYTAQRLKPDSSAASLPLLRKPYAQAELSEAVKDAIGGLRRQK